MAKISRIFFFILCTTFFISEQTAAQVNTVTYGRNRVQYKKFKWKYYRTKNFNTYFNQHGEELAKFVAQVAEEELPQIEHFTEYSIHERTTIVVYNSFADMQQTNIGLESNWQQNTGGMAQLVNDKMIVYFNGDHQDLRRQIREGITKVLMKNLFFGTDLGEYASNQSFLDLPQWLTDGYVAFVAENWNTSLDDQLKNVISSGKYRNFYNMVYDNPQLAGHAFWYYIEEKYKKENTTYFLYLTRITKSLNKASMAICKKKFNEVLKDFMAYEDDKYENDNNKRRTFPKGNAVESFDVNKRLDYYHINVNPNKKNNSYTFVRYRKGIVSLYLNEDDNYTLLLKYGIRSNRNETDPNYPLVSWDPKGTRLAVVYAEEGRLKLFVYDVVNQFKPVKLDLTDTFDQVQDVKYMLDSRTLLLSAAKNGHTDIYTLNLETSKIRQITNDVYDDLDATFVSFPNKTGIIFASDRPTADSKGGDTSLPNHNRYNIFLVTDYGDKPELNQVTQLTHLQYGNARYPSPYNSNHFTFISDENGIANRYAGFFTTQKEGVDTLVIIGDDILRNPAQKEVDSMLVAHKKDKPDSVAVVTISKDSAYSFPITNYGTNILETRIAGDNNQVSEVTRDEDEKTVYKLRIDENALQRRNITARPTTYMRNVIMADKIEKQLAVPPPKAAPVKDSVKTIVPDVFQSEFSDEKTDNSALGKVYDAEEKNESSSVLQKARLYDYKPVKFSAEYASLGFNSDIIFNTLQKYQGGTGPIVLNAGSPLDALTKLGTTELLEDQKINGAFSTNFQNSQWLINYQNYKRRWDWGLTYYRASASSSVTDTINTIPVPYSTKIITNIALANVAYPLDRARRVSLNFGIRSDRTTYVTNLNDTLMYLAPPGFKFDDAVQTFAVTHLEYVYDNTLNPAQNIWDGLRYKFYIDWNTDISKEKNNSGKSNFNWGFDARYYVPIYRDFIWAGRAAGYFSWGSQKTIYYLGGEDGWVSPKFNSNNKPAQDQTYAFQGLAVNLRGFDQNVANGNNALVLNSEFRLPLFTTLINRPITNTLLRNFQLVQFIDLGNAWNGSYNSLQRPETIYGDPTTPQVRIKAGGVGPLVGGYGFGARTALLGYYVKLDAGWPMIGIFRGKPIWYFSLGLDF